MKKLILMLLFVPILFAGCKKEGCTDPDSTQYDEKAKKDDGSCEYEGQIAFWLSKDKAEYYFDLGVVQFNVYMNGNYIGAMSASNYFNSEPSCEANGLFTYKYDLGKSKSLSYTVKFIDEDGIEWYEATANFTANECRIYELQ